MTAAVNAFDLVTLTPTRPARTGMRFHLLGDDRLTGGAARWEEVERPRRKSATEWIGATPYKLELPLLSDGMDDITPGVDHNITGDLNALISWMDPDPTTDIPLVLRVEGPVKLPPGNPRWVITDIAFADAAVRRPDGKRIQQAFTVTLLEYTEAVVFLGPAAAARAQAGL